jgi:hypothetical protein
MAAEMRVRIPLLNPKLRILAGEQTFRSAFDSFVSSEPGGFGIYERGNLISSNQEKHSCYMLNL